MFVTTIIIFIWITCDVWSIYLNIVLSSCSLGPPSNGVIIAEEPPVFLFSSTISLLIYALLFLASLFVIYTHLSCSPFIPGFSASVTYSIFVSFPSCILSTCWSHLCIMHHLLNHLKLDTLLCRPHFSNIHFNYSPHPTTLSSISFPLHVLYISTQ